MSDRISEADVERIARRVVELLRPTDPVTYQPQMQRHPYTGVMQPATPVSPITGYDWSTFTIGGKP